jgi:cold shock CspA family protein
VRRCYFAMRRQLQDVVRKRGGHVKEHEVAPHGVIAELHSEADYGIIASSDGREIYFHRNSVADGGFDVLHKGQEVRFSETEGDKGPQATFVRPAGKHHLL